MINTTNQYDTSLKVHTVHSGATTYRFKGQLLAAVSTADTGLLRALNGKAVNYTELSIYYVPGSQNFIALKLRYKEDESANTYRYDAATLEELETVLRKDQPWETVEGKLDYIAVCILLSALQLCC